MSLPPATPDRRITMQFLYTALAEGALLIAVVLFFIIEPQTMLTVIGAAIAFVVGLVVGIFAIYKAVPLMSEPATRRVGYVSVALIVTGPLMLFAVSQFI